MKNTGTGLLVLAVLALVMSAAKAQTSSDGIGPNFARGKALYDQRDFRQAVKYLQLAYQGNENVPDTCYLIGVAYIQLNSPTRGKQYLNYLVKHYPGSPNAPRAASVLQQLERLQRQGVGANIQVRMAPQPQQSKPSQPLRIQQERQPIARTLPNTAKNTADQPRSPVHSTANNSGEETSLVEGPNEANLYYDEKQNQLWLPAELNGRRMELLLDTGAPKVVIGKNQLENVGIKSPTGPATGTVGGSSSNAQIPYWNMKATLKVGPFTLHDITIQVLEHNHSSPLLGQEFLKYFDYTVDQGSRSVQFRCKNRATSSLTQGYEIPFTYRENGHRIIVEVEVNGKKSPMMLDTGNSASGVSFNSPEQAKNYGAPIPENATQTTHSGVSGSGEAYEFTVQRMRLGPIDKTDIDASAHINYHDNEEPLLGFEFFNGWQYTINMQKKVLHLLRR